MKILYSFIISMCLVDAYGMENAQIDFTQHLPKEITCLILDNTLRPHEPAYEIAQKQRNSKIAQLIKAQMETLPIKSNVTN